MWSKTTKAIPGFAVASVLMLSIGVESTRGAWSPLDEPLQAEDMTREELVSLYPSLAGVSFEPRPCVAGEEMFDDVPAGNLFCPWIEELARRGVTEGCAATRYCPGDAVTRAQMAAFLVRTAEACPTLDPTDEMIRVGGVCIDKYEASIWDAPVGGNQVTGETPCSRNGQDCDNIYARSVVGVEPAGDITWFQAQAALANSGKRLPTNAEWQMAVLGTPDPGDAPGPEDCKTLGPVARTGEQANCVSRWGAHDMVGNVWEWVADWDETAEGCEVWPSPSGDDLTCIGRGDGDPVRRVPGALLRGGRASTVGSVAGSFAVSARFTPSLSGVSGGDFGFRGAR